jgi:hypothetical protein
MDLDYNTRLAAIQRNEKLAQIMQQQAFQPIEVQSYNGIPAPISPLSGLAKVLQSYMGARGTGDEERIKLAQEAKAEAQQMLSSLNPTATAGRPAIMGRPEVPAQAATSFKPTAADFEDNPNLAVAPSGNVETPAVPYQPAVAPQAAIPAQSGAPLGPDEKRQRLVQMMMSQNPYVAPVAKLMYESLEKEATGPLAEYRLAVQQGYKGTMKDYQIEQAHAKRQISNTVVNMPHGAPFTVMYNGEQRLAQAGPNGQIKIIEGVSPVPAKDSLNVHVGKNPTTGQMEQYTLTPEGPKWLGISPMPQAANVVQTDRGPIVVNPDSTANPVTINNQPVGKEPKPVPEPVLKALTTNSTNLRQVDTALQLLKGNEVDGMKGDPTAIGPITGRTPDTVLQKTNPQGVITRAAIADIGSMIIHDRSGAAVTVSEMPRLIPFIPSITDSPEAAKSKLTRLKAELTNINNEFQAVHEASGYTMPKTGLQPNANVVNPKPVPTQADINYARNNPAVRQKFRDKFGIEP